MDLIELAAQHQWVAIASVVIGTITRMTKEDTIGFTVPSRWRPLFALGLGVASGVIEALATGRAWPQALTGGVVSAAVAVIGHGALIRGLAGGKEIPVPGLMVQGEAKLDALESKRDVAVAAVKAVEVEQAVATIQVRADEVAASTVARGEFAASAVRDKAADDVAAAKAKKDA